MMTYSCRMLIHSSKTTFCKNETSLEMMMSESQDVISPKNICNKLVVSLNHEVAVYCQLCVALGGSGDGDDLRQEMLRHRERVCDICLKAKEQLLPLYKSSLKSPEAEYKSDIESLCFLFSGCLELFKVELNKALLLHRLFPLSSGTVCLINTGLSSPHPGNLPCISLTTVNGHVEKMARETEILTGMERDLRHIKGLENDVDQLISVQPWTVEPEITTDNLANDDSSSSDDSLSLDIRIGGPSTESKGKYTWLAIVILSVVVVVGCVVGLVVGLA